VLNLIGKPFYWAFRAVIRAAFERAREDELKAIREELCPGQKEIDEATAALALPDLPATEQTAEGGARRRGGKPA
jgi:hypothetical protein